MGWYGSTIFQAIFTGDIHWAYSLGLKTRLLKWPLKTGFHIETWGRDGYGSNHLKSEHMMIYKISEDAKIRGSAGVPLVYFKNQLRPDDVKQFEAGWNFQNFIVNPSLAAEQLVLSVWWPNFWLLPYLGVVRHLVILIGSSCDQDTYWYSIWVAVPFSIYNKWLYYRYTIYTHIDISYYVCIYV